MTGKKVFDKTFGMCYTKLMSRNTKTVLKYEGMGFLVGFVGFWILHYLLKYTGNALFFLTVIPGIYLSLFVRLGNDVYYFWITSVGVGIAGSIVGALIGLIKSYRKKK